MPQHQPQQPMFAGQQLMGPIAADVAMQYSSQLVDHGKQYVHGQVSFILSLYKFNKSQK